jgi:hypothetical protein
MRVEIWKNGSLHRCISRFSSNRAGALWFVKHYNALAVKHHTEFRAILA